MYGFAKSKQENIEKYEEETFKKAAKELLALTDDQLDQLLKSQGLVEVNL